ncbi:probable palmitoyltransferase ZDHHC24 [Drosophila hydei]|uniref:Palmitoyltransferase n=1 Tax=Drosophila hydei TaxID=7224 RepID=A0A6J1LGE0_DROHY|nr:probable palmitoyltransferase ZDHHC24 [Drosophila hydei]
MKFRRNPLPKKWFENLCFFGIIVLVTFGFACDMFILLPAVHDRNSVWYKFNIGLAVFLLYNVLGNLIACLIIDTSVDFERCKVPPEGDEARLEWRHCLKCDGLVPPRAWHCKVCDVCILKRDHHCNITGCCVGYCNIRYFVCFILHVFYGSIYTTIYQLYYMSQRSYISLIKEVLLGPFPILDLTVLNLLCLKFIAVYGSCVSLYYYTPLVLQGTVRFDRGKHNKYNCGLAYNLKSVFGERMLWVLLSPLLTSKLPTDGCSFKTNSAHLSSANEIIAV